MADKGVTISSNGLNYGYPVRGYSSSPLIYNTTPPSSYKNYIQNGDFRVDEKRDGWFYNLVSQTQSNLYWTYNLAPERWFAFSQAEQQYNWCPDMKIYRASTWFSNGTNYINTYTPNPNHSHQTSLRVENWGINANGSTIGIAQRIVHENCIDLAYQEMTLSCWLKAKTTANTTNKVFWTVYEPTGDANANYPSIYGIWPQDVNFSTGFPATYTTLYNFSFRSNTNVVASGTFDNLSESNETFCSATFNLGAQAYRGLMVEFKIYVSSVYYPTVEYFHITGVQLERGNSATEYEKIPYDQQLKDCQFHSYTFGGFGTESVPIRTLNNLGQYCPEYGGVFPLSTPSGWGERSYIGRIHFPVPQYRPINYYNYIPGLIYNSFAAPGSSTGSTGPGSLMHSYDKTYPTGQGTGTTITQITPVGNMFPLANTTSSKYHLDVSMPSVYNSGSAENYYEQLQPSTSVIWSASDSYVYTYVNINVEP